MKAVSWILYALVAFGLGTGVAFAVHPPTVGIPAATADGLAGDLAAIQRYAAEGRCDAVEGRLDGAQSKISKLPNSTSTEVVDELQQSLRRVSTAARATCQGVADAEAAKEQRLREAREAAEEAARATTPTTPPPPIEETTPDPGADDGGPDPGTGEGDEDDGTTPAPEVPDTGGGVVPDVEAVQQELRRQLKEEQKKWKSRMREFEERWAQ